MPIFDFKCTECGRVEEIIVMGNTNRKFGCEECGAPMKKQLGVCLFKVNGFSESNGYGDEDPNRGVEQW